MMGTLMKKVIANGLLLIASTLLSLLLMELVIRVFNLAPGKKEIVLNERCTVLITPEYSHYTVLNSLGLRDFRELLKVSKSRRLLFLGDSFVFGAGVSNHETMASQTEILLNAQSQNSWTIINAGKSGTGTYYQVNRLKDLLRRINVNGVVLFYFVDNDPYETVTEFQEARKSKESGQRPARHSISWKTWAWEHTAVYRFLKLRLGTVGTLRQFPNSAFDQCEFAKIGSFRKNDELTRSLLSETQTLLKAQGIDLFVVIIPRQEWISEQAFDAFKKAYRVSQKNYDRFLPAKRIKQNVLEALGLDYIDLMDFLNNKSPRDFYFRDDGHFNANGNRFVAEIVAPVLIKRFQESERAMTHSGE
jgi:lysophospholipase L1-like esterase